MRNLTKESRLKSRESQFTYLVNNGYIRETYKGLDFFTKDEGKYFALKIFRGTAANHELYMHYHTAERRAAVIQQYKDGHERREAWKAEQKEKNKGKLSSHAAAAAAIRSELKAAFPSVKFSVTSESFAGGDSVNITWIDGVTVAQVEEFSSKYQYGHFNGMDDIYEHTNSREDIPQTKYVTESRTMSSEAKEAIFARIKNEYNLEKYEAYEIDRLIYQEFSKTDFSPKQEPTPENSNPDKVQIVDYSEKAFAVVGNFSAHYDNLIKLGGAYNSRLKCGKGIIFSKKKLEDVKAYFLAAKGEKQTEPKQAAPQPQILALPAPQPTEPETVILPTPQTAVKPLEYFKIMWHEGRSVPDYNGHTFATWEEVQTAFLNLWEVNEKHQDGGYTKVKCEIKLQGSEAMTGRIDITNRISNGDFNPSQEHILTYLESMLTETEETQPTEPTEAEPIFYNNLPDIRKAAQEGKVISLFNLSQLVNQ